MNLFVVNRYKGEGEVETERSKDDTSHLGALLEKIERRKKEKAAAVRDTTYATDDSLQTVTGARSERREKKHEPVDECTVARGNSPSLDETYVNDDTQERTLNEPPMKKKKKERKATEIRERASNDKGSSTEQEVEKNIAPATENEKLTGDTVNEPSERQDFVVLGAKTRKKVHAVKRVLPHWLAHPEVISADLNSGPRLEELDSVLDPKLVKVLRNNGIDKLFPVQASTISWLLKCNNDRKLGWWPRDTCVSAPTGSGKTLAYVLPIVQHLQNRFIPKIRCLVVLPVQELAAQVHKVMLTYTAHTRLKVGSLTGASSFEQEQRSVLTKNARGESVITVDIVIATPGRLVDHILKTPGFSLDALRFLIIDEADRVTDWLQYLPAPHARAPSLNLANVRSSKTPPAQKLLFSATLSQDPEKLSRLALFQPILFTSVAVSGQDDDVNLDKEFGDFIGRYTSPEELIERAVECPAEYKPIAVHRLIANDGVAGKALIFTNSGESAHRLALLLQSLFDGKNMKIGELSAQLLPKQRRHMLNRFSSGAIHVLVSSDALARGLDIPDIELVVSYDLPKHIKGYIHRAGRTGRAGKRGTAVSVLTPNQVGIFKQMLIAAHKTVPDIERMALEEAADALDYQTRVEELREALENEQARSLQRNNCTKRTYNKRTSGKRSLTSS